LAQVKLSALEDHQIDEAVDMFLDAFRTEAFTVVWLDLGQSELRKIYYHAVRLKFELSLAAGQPLIAALLSGQVIALAVVKSPHLKNRLWQIFRIVIARLHRLVGLMPHFLRAAHLAKAVKPPEILPKMYYTLEILAVHPAYQDRGLGRMLLANVERLARCDPAATGIYLLTGDEKNRLIYEKASYQLIEARPSRDLTAYHMFLPF